MVAFEEAKSPSVGVRVSQSCLLENVSKEAGLIRPLLAAAWRRGRAIDSGTGRRRQS